MYDGVTGGIGMLKWLRKRYYALRLWRMARVRILPLIIDGEKRIVIVRFGPLGVKWKRIFIVKDEIDEKGEMIPFEGKEYNSPSKG